MKYLNRPVKNSTLAVLGFLGFLIIQDTASAKKPSAEKQQVLKEYGNLPLRFEVNSGQTDSKVHFISHGNGYTMFLTTNEAVMVFSKPVKANAFLLRDDEPHMTMDKVMDKSVPKIETTVLRIKLVGAKTPSAVTGLKKLPGITNYFIGNNPQKWHTNVPGYAMVEYQEVYEGINLVYYGNQRQLEYDFVVSPGTDPKVIKLDFEGAERLEIDGEGNLIIHTGGSEIQQRNPVIYQEVDGKREAVQGGYVLNEKQQVSFKIAEYDQAKPLVIDPILSYSTYLGGSSEDRGWGIAVDGSGNAYVLGETYTFDFPSVNPPQNYFGGKMDILVSKLNPLGNALIFSTYLGGSDNDYGYGITVDNSGSVYVTGYTYSSNFPTENPFQNSIDGYYDAFVTKINPSGSALDYSTYLGGNSAEIGCDIAVDGLGSAYIAGRTWSSNFPTVNPFQNTKSGSYDVFVTKFDPSGSTLDYSTYLGGNSADYGWGIAVDGSGNAYVSGRTYSSNFPTMNPFQGSFGGYSDAFVFKLSNSGSVLVYSTYLGGDFYDAGRGIALDRSGSAYVTGYTGSANFPLMNPFQNFHGGDWWDVFVTKLNPSGSALDYSTFLGGSSNERGVSIAVDGSGNAYLTGFTWSANFPTINPLENSFGGSCDGFVTKINLFSSTLDYSTYLGGSSYDRCNDLAVDGAGSVFLTGYTASSNFPTMNPLQGTHGGGWSDSFVAKISSAIAPEEALDFLTGNVLSLVAIGTLSQGQGNALTSKLRAVVLKLDTGKIKTAINRLGAFINQVNAFINSGILTADKGQQLINSADQIITLLENSNKKMVASHTLVPDLYALDQNFPNPFNPITTIRFDLPETGDVSIIVYNMLGQRIRTFDYHDVEPGYHSIRWDAKNDIGGPVGAGVYLYQLSTKNYVKTRKMVLLK